MREAITALSRALGIVYGAAAFELGVQTINVDHPSATEDVLKVIASSTSLSDADARRCELEKITSSHRYGKRGCNGHHLLQELLHRQKALLPLGKPEAFSLENAAYTLGFFEGLANKSFEQSPEKPSASHDNRPGSSDNSDRGDEEEDDDDKSSAPVSVAERAARPVRKASSKAEETASTLQQKRSSPDPESSAAKVSSSAEVSSLEDEDEEDEEEDDDDEDDDEDDDDDDDDDDDEVSNEEVSGEVPSTLERAPSRDPVVRWPEDTKTRFMRLLSRLDRVKLSEEGNASMFLNRFPKVVTSIFPVDAEGVSVKDPIVPTIPVDRGWRPHGLAWWGVQEYPPGYQKDWLASDSSTPSI
ncbi:Hypothetical Protein FCC1311_002692 [Hondaea fermentalgiana]|uniref:Uncharacterized protein n=1 Tax=Hondaea fermentalgiana TaxID=2315210 RepID=A0A2R5G7N6_9STRA|nr:Hypothetical Protein FCC1311_002692 [Hondaea fermentalgiana]|eukprot:GBG24051.1 Hypothetical Protein FCC1311_002692 [Hondaea fermentalgiana]